MARLSEFVLRHKLLVVLFWLAVFACGVFASSEVGGRLSQDFSFPGEPGYEANVDILKKYGNGGPGNPLVPVVTLPEGKTVESAGVREALGQTLGRLAQESGSRVVSYADTGDRGLVADGARTTFALVMVPGYGGMRDDLASQSGGSEEESGVLVTSAALILFLAFVALASVPETDVKIMATGLDATVLRALLVPALVSLSGRWTWWLPSWVARLLRVPPSPRRRPRTRGSAMRDMAGS
jgi:RND superfamily putative drug exporter